VINQIDLSSYQTFIMPEGVIQPPSPPNPPTTASAQNYIWNTLENVLQENEPYFSSTAAWQAAGTALQNYYVQAGETSDPAQLTAILDEAMQTVVPEPLSPSQQAAQIVQQAQSAESTLNSNIQTVDGQISALGTDIGNLQAEIQNLEGEMSSPPTPAEAAALAQAQNDLSSAQSQLAVLQSQKASLITELATAESLVSQLQTDAGGTVTPATVTAMQALLTQLQGIAVPSSMASEIETLAALVNTTLPNDVQAMDNAIHGGPTPPPTASGNTVWVDDWNVNLDSSSYIQQLISQGVQNVNIFVGDIQENAGPPPTYSIGVYTTGSGSGSGAFPSLAALKDFVSQLKAAGISVKLSVGGAAGTSFGQSWNVLNGNPNATPPISPSTAISAVAAAMVQICQETGANGIDFDYEESSVVTAGYAGQVAAQFIEQSQGLGLPLIATFDAFGGADDEPSGPNPGPNPFDAAFFAGAVMKNGHSAISGINLMLSTGMGIL
jgi:hypothetical protein